MVSTENKIFAVVGVLVLAAALLVYAVEYLGEDEVAIVSIATTTVELGTTMPGQVDPPYRENPGSRLGVSPASRDSSPQTTQTTTTTSTTTVIQTTTTSTTPPEATDHLSKYRNQGYRQAYMNITFLCPSCVPAVAANLRNEQGVIAKSMSYGQRVSWIIYDPAKVSLERIYQLATANGEGILLNDTEL